MITYDIAIVFQTVLTLYHHMSRVQSFKTPLGWLAYGILLPTLLGIPIVHETGNAVLDQPVLNGMTFRVSNIPISTTWLYTP